MPNEIIWKKFDSGGNRYEVSNTGEIRSLIYKNPKILKQFISKHGYKILAIRPQKDISISVRAHRIVAEAFLGKCPDGYVVNHIDGNKLNNNIDNLEYVTSFENNIHAIKNGLRKIADMNKVIKIGEEHPRSKITEVEAIEILKCHFATGYGCRKVSKILNIPSSITDGIISNKRWVYLDREKIKNEVMEEIEKGECIYV